MNTVGLQSKRRRAAVLAAAVVLASGLQGCATRQDPDPLESWNRQVFAFNDSLDANVLQPVARGYNAVAPEPVRTSVRNVFNNIRDVWSTVNLFLQGRFADGSLSSMRVLVNTTLGIAGIVDWGTPMRLDRPNEDFGQTLGVWGVKPGAYIVWPVLGPSTVRDSLGIPGDLYFSAATLTHTDTDAIAASSLQVISLRAELLKASGLVDDVALDKYAFTRDAYLQRRQNLIYEGDPPEEPEPEDEAPDDAAADPDKPEPRALPAATAGSTPSAPASATPPATSPATPAASAPR